MPQSTGSRQAGKFGVVAMYERHVGLSRLSLKWCHFWVCQKVSYHYVLRTSLDVAADFLQINAKELGMCAGFPSQPGLRAMSDRSRETVHSSVSETRSAAQHSHSDPHGWSLRWQLEVSFAREPTACRGPPPHESSSPAVQMSGL